MAEKSTVYFPRSDKLEHLDTYISFKDILTKIQWKQDSGNKILDVECGKGEVSTLFLWKMLPSNYDEILAVDRSEELIAAAKEAQEKDPELKDSKVVYQVMDIEQNLSKELEGKFDLVTSFYSHYWVVDILKAMTNLGKCVKPGGNFILSFVNYDYYDTVLKEMAKSIKWEHHTKEESQLVSPFQNLPCTKLDMATYLKKTGFKTANYNSWPHERPVNREEFIEFLKPWDAFKSEPTQVEKDEFLEDLINEITKLGFIRSTIVEGRQYVMKYSLITVHAVKADEEATVET